MTKCHQSQLTICHSTKYPARQLSGKSQNVTLSVVPKLTKEMEHRLAFARRLEAARIASGYPEPADFARALGIKPNTYGRYENSNPSENRKFPTFKIPELCRLTGFPAWFFLTGERSEPAHGSASRRQGPDRNTA